MKIYPFDIETNGLEIPGGIVWVLAGMLGNKMHVQSDCNGLKYINEDIAVILEDPTILKVIHNAGFDAPFCFHRLKRKNGKPVTIRNIWDTDLCEQVIQGVQATTKLEDDHPFRIAHGTRLKDCLKRYGLKDSMNKDLVFNFVGRPTGIPFTKEETKYYQDDVKYLVSLMKAQEYILRRDKLLEVALLENLFVELVINMKCIGIGFDKNIWADIANRSKKEYDRRIALLPKEVSNWGSEKQVKAYFKRRGILIESYNLLEKVYLATRSPVLKQFIDARELHADVTKYGIEWNTNGYVWADNRIHFDMRQIVNTGRNSISNPPLQGLKKEGLHRSAFVSRKGHRFVRGDFGGQELGIMAAASNEKIWIDAMLRGDDIHSLTASLLYASEWQEASTKKCTFPKKCSCPGHKVLREYAKTLNFMLAYGGGSNKFAFLTGLSNFEARVTVLRYKKIIPKITLMLTTNGINALDTGETYSADPYKRRRVLIGEEEWHVRNQGKNSPIQMAGANMMKLAAISIPRKYYFAMPWHDEIILEVPTGEAKQAAKVLKKVMESSADYITSIKGLIKVNPIITTNLIKE